MPPGYSADGWNRVRKDTSPAVYPTISPLRDRDRFRSLANRSGKREDKVIFLFSQERSSENGSRSGNVFVPKKDSLSVACYFLAWGYNGPREARQSE